MITVIVPIYNTEQYLKKCLDSILNQTYKEMEVILVDDGSTDSSGEICKEYEKNDSRITYYKLENGGQGRARNYALDRCHGDWIAFVDSDDYIEVDMLEKMLSCADENAAEIAICGWYRDHGFQKREQPSPKEIGVYTTEELLKEYIATSNITSSMCNKIYKKDLWNDIRFPEIRAREDETILYRVLAKANKAVHIAESKYNQYVRPGSTERQGFTKDKMVSIQINESIKGFIESNYPNIRDYAALLPAKWCVYLMAEILQSFSYSTYINEYNELYDKLKNEMSKEYSEAVIESDDYKRFKKVVYGQFNFKVNSFISGLKILMVDMLKGILVKFKR